MQIWKNVSPAPVLLAAVALTASLLAQAPPQQPQGRAGGRGGAQAGRGGRGGGGGGGGGGAYPQREAADPAIVARGQALWGVHCAFCHGPDARGGSEGGPNLLRSDLVLNDQNGELIAQVVQNGRGAMPKLNLTMAQITDVAAFVHSFRVGGYDVTRNRPPSIVVGDAKTGEAYFKSTCASCHSITGDLKGYAGKFTDERQLQQTWIMPGGGGRGGSSPVEVPPVTVIVTPASGPKVEGPLVRIDDFIVILTDADGVQRTFRRDGDKPKVELRDPLEPHRKLLTKYTDTDIHNLTAYLVTLK